MVEDMAETQSSPKPAVKITYSHSGTVPPVYIATSMSTPPWDPIEMQVNEKTTDDGETVFYKEFQDVEDGEYQYKFRLGPGDWWVLDETAETAVDDLGNRNNRLVVKANMAVPQERASDIAPIQLPTPPSEPEPTQAASKPLPEELVEQPAEQPAPSLPKHPSTEQTEAKLEDPTIEPPKPKVAAGAVEASSPRERPAESESSQPVVEKLADSTTIAQFSDQPGTETQSPEAVPSAPETPADSTIISHEPTKTAPSQGAPLDKTVAEGELKNPSHSGEDIADVSPSADSEPAETVPDVPEVASHSVAESHGSSEAAASQDAVQERGEAEDELKQPTHPAVDKDPVSVAREPEHVETVLEAPNVVSDSATVHPEPEVAAVPEVAKDKETENELKESVQPPENEEPEQPLGSIESEPIKATPEVHDVSTDSITQTREEPEATVTSWDVEERGEAKSQPPKPEDKGLEGETEQPGPVAPEAPEVFPKSVSESRQEPEEYKSYEVVADKGDVEPELKETMPPENSQPPPVATDVSESTPKEHVEPEAGISAEAGAGAEAAGGAQEVETKLEESAPSLEAAVTPEIVSGKQEAKTVLEEPAPLVETVSGEQETETESKEPTPPVETAASPEAVGDEQEAETKLKEPAPLAEAAASTEVVSGEQEVETAPPVEATPSSEAVNGEKEAEIGLKESAPPVGAASAEQQVEAGLKETTPLAEAAGEPTPISPVDVEPEENLSKGETANGLAEPKALFVAVPQDVLEESGPKDEIPVKAPETTGPGDATSPTVPTLRIEKTDDKPSFGEDLGPEATSAEKVAHENRAADAQPDEVIISPDLGSPKSLAEQNPEFAAALGTSDESSPIGATPAHERAPLFSHESFTSPDAPAPLFAHEQSFEDSNDVREITAPPEPQTAGEGPPLFTFETDPELLASTEPRKEVSQPSAKSIGSHDDEDIHDPSIEPFPTNREAIYEAIQRTESRLEEDDSVPESPHSPARSRTTSSVEPSSPLPLTAIKEDESENQVEDSVALPSTANEHIPVTVAEKAASEDGSSKELPEATKPAEEVASQATPTEPEVVDPIPDATNEVAERPIAATAVPEIVKESIEEAHQDPEAAAVPEMVAEKQAVQAELKKEVNQAEELGEPAPAISAALIETAPALTGEPTTAASPVATREITEPSKETDVDLNAEPAGNQPLGDGTAEHEDQRSEAEQAPQEVEKKFSKELVSDDVSDKDSVMQPEEASDRPSEAWKDVESTQGGEIAKMDKAIDVEPPRSPAVGVDFEPSQEQEIESVKAVDATAPEAPEAAFTVEPPEEQEIESTKAMDAAATSTPEAAPAVESPKEEETESPKAVDGRVPPAPEAVPTVEPPKEEEIESSKAVGATAPEAPEATFEIELSKEQEIESMKAMDATAPPAPEASLAVEPPKELEVESTKAISATTPSVSEATLVVEPLEEPVIDSTKATSAAEPPFEASKSADTSLFETVSSTQTTSDQAQITTVDDLSPLPSTIASILESTEGVGTPQLLEDAVVPKYSLERAPSPAVAETVDVKPTESKSQTELTADDRADSTKTNDKLPSSDLQQDMTDATIRAGRSDQQELLAEEPSSAQAPLTPPLTPTADTGTKEPEPIPQPETSKDITEPSPQAPAQIETTPEAPKPAQAAPARADAESSELRQRKTAKPPLSQDRSLTPSGVSSPAQQRKRETFFQHVWRVLFGGWLGNLGRWFARLCGGRRRAT